MTTKFLRFAILGAMSLPLLFGQSDVARIVGTITDDSGAVISGASVTIKDQTINHERKVTADAAGYYAVPNLAPSTYR